MEREQVPPPSSVVEQERETYLHYLRLWESENPIKTSKLQFLLLSNAILFATLALVKTQDGSAFYIALGGTLANLVWIFSIGRTCLFQKAWQIKLRAIAKRYPEDSRFQILDTEDAEAAAPEWLRKLGGVSSKYYLMGAPIGFFGFWFLMLLFAA